MAEQTYYRVDPPDLQIARQVVYKLQTLEVGQSFEFDPVLTPEVQTCLFMLLMSVDKGWRMDLEVEERRGWRRILGPRSTGNLKAIMRCR